MTFGKERLERGCRKAWWRLGPALVLYLVVHGSPACAQWEDVSVEALLIGSASGSTFGCGLSCADYNGDGWDDVTLADASGTIRLYAGGPDGYTPDVELGDEFAGETKGVLWVDVDGDGDLDLFAGHRGQGVELYIRNDTGDLVIETVQRGLPDWPGWRPRGMSACDFDGDEDLDIYIASYHIYSQVEHYQNAFLINDGTGHFVLADDSVGVNNGVQTSFHGGWLDFDGDGWQDLWVINDRFSFSNSLYRNLGNGTFVDVAPEYGLDLNNDPMTATIFDPDLDGDWDLFTTDVPNLMHTFFEQVDSGFVEVAESIGLGGYSDYGWGACAVDIDGDMDQDLMVATMHWPFETAVDNRMYICDNEDGLNFTEDSTGWPNEQLPLYHLGRLDYDGDRAPDLAGYGVPPAVQLLRNTNPAGASRMTVRLVGTTANSHAVGAVIEVHAGGVMQMRQVDAGVDYVTQHSYTRFFGLGEEEWVDSLLVTWPNGGVEAWYGLPADTALVLIQGTALAAPEPLPRACPWEPLAWLVPFDPEEVDMTWNGNAVDGDTLWADGPGPHVLEASWWSGNHVMNWVLAGELADPPTLEHVLTDPGCLGEPAVLAWSPEGADAVFWSDSLLSFEDTLLVLSGGGGLLSWHHGPDCIVDTMIEVNSPPALLLDWVLDVPDCWGDMGVVEWEATGGTPPLVVDWDGADPAALGAGVWPVSLTDAAGCVVMDSVTVVIPDSLAVMADWSYIGGSDSVEVVLDITGGTPPFGIDWSGSADGNGLLLAPGIVGWLVEDAHGCLAFGTLQLDVNSVPLDPFGEWRCLRDGEWLVITGPSTGGTLALFDLTGRRLISTEWTTARKLPLSGMGPVLVRWWPDGGRPMVFLR